MKRLFLVLLISILSFTNVFGAERYDMLFEVFYEDEISSMNKKLAKNKILLKKIYNYDLEKVDIGVENLLAISENYEDLEQKTEKIVEKTQKIQEKYSDNKKVVYILDYLLLLIEKETLKKVKSNINFYNHLKNHYLDYEDDYIGNPVFHTREGNYTKERVLFEGRDNHRYYDLKNIETGIEQAFDDFMEYPSKNNFNSRISAYINIPKEALNNFEKNGCQFGYKYEVSKGLDQYRLSSCIEGESSEYKDGKIEIGNFDENFKAEDILLDF